MKKKKKTKKLYIFLAMFLMLIICFSFFLNGVVYPVVIEYAEAKVNNMTVNAVNRAIISVFGENTSYSDFVTINTDSQGNVQYIEANALNINKIAQQTAEKSRIELDAIGEEVLRIPVGSLTGSPLFTGYGPVISVKILTAGSVICRFKSQFTGAGINQTRHRIYIEVNANMDIVLPSSRKNIESKVEIFIAEAIIAGKVPDAFLNIGAFDRINFLPG